MMRNNLLCRFFYKIIFLIFLTSSAFSQSSTQAGSSRAVSLTDSLKADSSEINTLSLKPVIMPWQWKQFANLQENVVFEDPLGENGGRLNYVPPAYQYGQAYEGSLGDFQGSTAYLFSYTNKLRKDEQVKPEYGNYAFVVPIVPMVMLTLYGAKEGYLALQKDPPISFDETDLDIMALLWATPNLMAVDYYNRFNKLGKGNLTFMTLQQRMDQLQHQKLLTSEKDGSKNVRYELRYTQQELLQLLAEKLRKNDPNTQPERFSALEEMKRMLLARIGE